MEKQIARLNERLGWLRDRKADLSRLIDQMDEFGLDTTEADGPYYNKKEAIAELKQSLRNESSGDKEHTYYGFLYVGDYDDEGNIEDYDMEDPEISARNGRCVLVPWFL